MKEWLRLSYKSLREVVVYRQGKRKEQEEHMLVWMQYSSFFEAMEEFKKLFRQNRHLKLHRSRVFRAWYKHEIDYMSRNPEIYRMTMTDGTPYDKERDPFYDPNAPDWEQFDRRHYAYEDEEDEDEEDEDEEDEDEEDEDEEDEDEEDEDFTDSDQQLKNAAEDGFYIGLGLGAADSLLN